MNIHEMKIKDFENLPLFKDWYRIEDIDNIVILPTDEKCEDMEFILFSVVACRGDEPICKLEVYDTFRNTLGVNDFGIDILAKSKLVRIMFWEKLDILAYTHRIERKENIKLW